MALTTDAKSMWKQATKVDENSKRYLPEELETDCISIAEAIATMEGKTEIDFIHITEALQYCCGVVGKGIPSLKIAYDKVGQATYQDLIKQDKIYQDTFFNHPGNRKEKILAVGASPFEEKRMAEIYAVVYDYFNLPIVKV